MTTKTVRAMRARRSGLLGCGHFVITGQLIVKVGGRWICEPCRMAELAQLATTMRTPPRPSERGGQDGDNKEETP